MTPSATGLRAVPKIRLKPKNEANRSLVQIAQLEGLLPALRRAHDAIFAVAPKPENPRKAELIRLAAAEDGVHDVLARGIYGLLTEMALLDDDGDSLIKLRDRLMPDGVASAIRATYRGQAGYAALLRKRLTEPLKAELRAIPLRKGNLFDRVEAWLDAGDRLGQLEEERARLEKEDQTPIGTQTVNARNLWIRTVNAFLSVAAVTDLSEESERVLFGPLRDAEAKADLRAARRTATTVVDEALQPPVDEEQTLPG